MIMPGVTIGEGAIVAANSVVSKNVEPYSIVGGTPARHLKYRFEPKVIEQLLSLKIYQWSEKKFEALRPLLCQSSIDKLLIAEAQFIE